MFRTKQASQRLSVLAIHCLLGALIALHSTLSAAQYHAHHIRYTVETNDGLRPVLEETRNTCLLISQVANAPPGSVPNLPKEPVVQHSLEAYYAIDRLVLYRSTKQWSLKPKPAGCELVWSEKTDVEIHTEHGVCKLSPARKVASGDCSITLGFVSSSKPNKVAYTVPVTGTETVLGQMCTTYTPTAEAFANTGNMFSGSVCVFTPKSAWVAFMPRTWHGYQKGLVLRFNSNSKADLIGKLAASANELNLDIAVAEEILNPLKAGAYKVVDAKALPSSNAINTPKTPFKNSEFK
jgi:hypothetical protein